VTILLVDDDEDLRGLMQAVLEREDYEVAVAANGREALDWLRSGGRPALILLDLMMPEMNGWQFRAAQLAEPAWADIPVVVVTAGRNLEQAPIQVTDVLLKPFDALALVETVERVLAR
jgi:CheY-like chemotaxis protein